MEPIVKSAGRALAVLELFERERRPLGLTDVTLAMALPTSSAAALMKSLVSLGYLEYDRSERRYFPTMRIAALGGWIEEALFGSSGVVHEARRLHADTGLTVVLATRSDLHAQYLHLVHSGAPLSLAIAPGQLRPLAGSGMGWLLLSALSQAEVRALVRRIDYKAENKTDLPALFDQLNAVARSGYAFSRDQVSPGFGLIGVLLPAHVGGRRVGLGVTGRTEELERREPDLVDRLKHVTDDLRRHMESVALQARI